VARDADDAILLPEQVERLDGFLGETDDPLRWKHFPSGDTRHREALERRSFASTSSASDLLNAWDAFHMDKPALELEIGFGDPEYQAASLFAFSATFEICRDDTICRQGSCQNNGRPAGFPCQEYDLTAEDALLVLRIEVLGGRLPSRDQQPRKLGLRLLRLSIDELDQKFPFVAVVEEESHLGPDRRKGLDDTRPLDAPCVSLALSDIDKELISDGRIVNVSLQLAVEAERVVEVEIEGADNRLCEGVEAACACDLDVPIDFRR